MLKIDEFSSKTSNTLQIRAILEKTACAITETAQLILFLSTIEASML